MRVTLADEILLPELDGRHVHRDGDSFQFRASRQAWRSTHSPSSPIRPRSSATGMKSAGEISAVDGVVPADERLHAEDPVGRRPKTAAGSRSSSVRWRWRRGGPPPPACAGDGVIHADLEEGVAVPPLVLGPVERNVGQLHAACRGRCVLGGERDADRNADIELGGHPCRWARGWRRACGGPGWRSRVGVRTPSG